jgi:alanine dehydrogenase
LNTIILNRRDIKDLLDMKDIINALENVFKDASNGKTSMPAKAYLEVPLGDFRAMPAAIPGAAGIKWVNVHPGNAVYHLPTVMAVLVYNDPLTGYPLAIMDATDITAFRTGAAAAIASRYLARPDSQSLGIVGAGRQAYTQLQAHLELFDLKSILVYDKSKDAMDNFVEYFAGYPVKAALLEEVAGADIICTLTPSREPYLKKEWLHEGVHINAIGADARGKEELEPGILNAAIVVVDNIIQTSEAGEINVPVSLGLFKIKDIYATLCQIVGGKKIGRRNEKEITVFDATGIAIEDIAVAKLIYEKAINSGHYFSMNFIGDN